MPLSEAEWSDGLLISSTIYDLVNGATRTVTATGAVTTRALTDNERAMVLAAETPTRPPLIISLATATSAAITLLAPRTNVTFTWDQTFPNDRYGLTFTPRTLPVGMTQTWTKYPDRAVLELNGGGALALGSTSFTAVAYTLI